jgi:hypothetical protein
MPVLRPAAMNANADTLFRYNLGIFRQARRPEDCNSTAMGRRASALRAAAAAAAVALALSTTVASADPVPTPSMSASLAANPNPFSVNAGALGKIYIDGALTGLAFWQSNPVPEDRDTRFDLSNGQVFIQKTDGWLQFYVQAGAYSLPSLGTAYVKADDLLDKTYGVVTQAFVKLALADNFSIEAGKLPTLIGDEYTFTFENMNVERGLLWNQEPAVSRGVQANYTAGPLALSVSWNDGFYSNVYNWVSGSAAYTIDSSNNVSFIGGGNFGRTHSSSFATPLAQNNGDIFNLIYTHTSGAHGRSVRICNTPMFHPMRR